MATNWGGVRLEGGLRRPEQIKSRGVLPTPQTPRFIIGGRSPPDHPGRIPEGGSIVPQTTQKDPRRRNSKSWILPYHGTLVHPGPRCTRVADIQVPAYPGLGIRPGTPRKGGGTQVNVTLIQRSASRKIRTRSRPSPGAGALSRSGSGVRSYPKTLLCRSTSPAAQH